MHFNDLVNTVLRELIPDEVEYYGFMTGLLPYMLVETDPPPQTAKSHVSEAPSQKPSEAAVEITPPAAHVEEE